MKAFVKNHRQQPRKVRVVADLIRGKKVADALAALAFTDRRAAIQMEKALRSAIANAANGGKNESALYVKSVAVDKGITYKRFMPRARGAAAPINRRSSHITIVLGERS